MYHSLSFQYGFTNGLPTLSRLFQGANIDGTTFLFRVRRVSSVEVPADVMRDAGLDPATRVFVYFLVDASEWGEEPGPEITGPLTLAGAVAVARAFTDTFNRLTNFGAF